jgi:type VI secretion system FHA domain protein
MRTLSAGSLTIGRGTGNDWVLPDPHRILSKTHCVITAENGRFVLTDVSSNGVFINGAPQATSRDSATMLTDGDSFRLGRYTISVAEVDDGPVPNPGQNRAAGDLAGGAGADDPFNSDPFGIESFKRPPDPAFQHPQARTSEGPRRDDPFDERKPRAAGIGPAEDLFRGITPSVDWQGPSRADHTPAPAQAMVPPRVVRSTPPGEIDFGALIGDLVPNARKAAPPPAAPAPRTPPAAQEPNPFLEPAPPPSTRPAAHAPSPPSSSPVSEPSHAADSADARAAFRAFLDGAGVLGQRIDDGDPEAALRTVGQIFRALAEGVREILMSRAAIKAEMRILQTMIRAQDNNALKFSVSTDEAVLSLLGPRRPGYLDPLAAAKEAVADIKSHELAVMLGVRTALEALLHRFDPDALEERLTGRNRLEAMLPSARKARYWDAFRSIYREISREAEDDFQSMFGRSFAEAYSAFTRKD